MERKHRYLPWLACAAVAAVAIPAFASDSPASHASDSQASGAINAVDFAFENPATGASDVTINVGGTVTFAYPTGGNAHNVDFSAAQPTSCVQTAGMISSVVPPLPEIPQIAGWSGRCTFNTPGTYEFHCDAHAFMTGVVTVLPTPIPTPTPTGPAARHLKLARHQRGKAVRGSIVVARADSRLSVEVLAKPSALNRKGSARIRVGSVTKTANAGKATFSVALSKAARRALARRGSLALTVKIAVTPPSGKSFRATKKVTLKRH